MQNQRINFTLSKHHLASGLQAIRQLDPNYQITSISQIVKTCFFDYLAKTNYNKPNDISINDISAELLKEINDFLANKPLTKSTMSLDDLIELEEQNNQD